MKKMLFTVFFLSITLLGSPLGAKEVTYSSEDRDRLIKVETTLVDFKTSVDKRLEQMDKRFEDGQRSIDKRLDILTWMIGIFITAALAALGYEFTMLYRQGNWVSRVEATVEAQKDEIGFLKELVGKLLPVQGREPSKV